MPEQLALIQVIIQVVLVVPTLVGVLFLTRRPSPPVVQGGASPAQIEALLKRFKVGPASPEDPEPETPERAAGPQFGVNDSVNGRTMLPGEYVSRW